MVESVLSNRSKKDWFPIPISMLAPIGPVGPAPVGPVESTGLCLFLGSAMAK